MQNVFVVNRHNVQPFINKHNAISVSKRLIDRLIADGAVKQIRMVDTDTGHAFTADLSDFASGLVRDIGYGEQYFVAIELCDWKIPSRYNGRNRR